MSSTILIFDVWNPTHKDGDEWGMVSTKLLDFKDFCISKIRLDGYLDVVMGTGMFWLRGVFTEATHEANDAWRFRSRYDITRILLIFQWDLR